MRKTVIQRISPPHHRVLLLSLLYSNYTRNWSMYAVCASVEAQALRVLFIPPSFFKFNLLGASYQN